MSVPGIMYVFDDTTGTLARTQPIREAAHTRDQLTTLGFVTGFRVAVFLGPLLELRDGRV